MNNPLQATCFELTRRIAGAELVTVTPTNKQVRLTFRVPKGRSSSELWQELLKQLYRLSRSAPWTLDLSKHHFITEGSDDDFRWSWRIIVQGENIQTYDAQIAGSLKAVSVPSKAVQLNEVALHGSPNRSPTAGLAGYVPVGPLAVRTR